MPSSPTVSDHPQLNQIRTQLLELETTGSPSLTSIAEKFDVTRTSLGRYRDGPFVKFKRRLYATATMDELTEFRQMSRTAWNEALDSLTAIRKQKDANSMLVEMHTELRELLLTVGTALGVAKPEPGDPKAAESHIQQITQLIVQPQPAEGAEVTSMVRPPRKMPETFEMVPIKKAKEA